MRCEITRLGRRSREHGVIAIEYVLIAAMISLGTVGAFAFFRNEVRAAIGALVSHVSDSAIQSHYYRK